MIAWHKSKKPAGAKNQVYLLFPMDLGPWAIVATRLTIFTCSGCTNAVAAAAAAVAAAAAAAATATATATTHHRHAPPPPPPPRKSVGYFVHSMPPTHAPHSSTAHS